MGEHIRLGSMDGLEGLVTDLDLEEWQHDHAWHVHQAHHACQAHHAHAVAFTASPEAPQQSFSPMMPAPTLAEEKEHPLRKLSKLSVRSSNANLGSGHDSSHASIMVWLGILIDAVPESLVIGILINKGSGAGEGASFASSTSAALPFVIGVFLSNLPESMSSAGSMRAHGMSVRTILLMWSTITVLTAIGASVGA